MQDRLRESGLSVCHAESEGRKSEAPATGMEEAWGRDEPAFGGKKQGRADGQRHRGGESAAGQARGQRRHSPDECGRGLSVTLLGVRAVVWLMLPLSVSKCWRRGSFRNGQAPRQAATAGRFDKRRIFVNGIEALERGPMSLPSSSSAEP